VLRPVLKRLAVAPAVLLVLATITFFLVRLAPGGPFAADRRLEPSVEAALQAQYHLDESQPQQYLRFLGDLVQGDLGPSFRHPGERVGERILRFLPVSMGLGLIALLLALVMGVTAGTWAAVRRNRPADHATMVVALIGLTVPTFVVGPVLALVFGLWLGWLPVAEWKGFTQPIYLVLPVITLALPFAARVARLTRAGMLEVLNADYVRTARAKGLSGRAVVWRHVMRGGLLPVIAFVGPAAADLLTGSVVVETVFAIPGIGPEFVQAALSRDYTMVMGTVLVYGALLIAFNLLSDIGHALADPRVGNRE
jgi:oligopeptide transport system permease protein